MSKAQSAEAVNKNTIAVRLIFALYQLIQIVLAPLAAVYLLYRVVRNSRYLHGLGERLGILPAHIEGTGPETVWFHAVSVGEVLSAARLIAELRRLRPEVEVFLSTATLAGRATAEQRLGQVADGIFFAPLDYKSVVRRVLRRLRPSAVVVLETEIWPNLYREAKHSGASLLIVNARISDEALPKYRNWRSLFRHVLTWPDRILVQSDQDRQRYELAGAPGDVIECLGNLKYDLTPPRELSKDLKSFFNGEKARSVWVAASTMAPAVPGDPDEDEAVIQAFQSLTEEHPGLLLVLAPRHPERFDEVARKLDKAGVRYLRRSQLNSPEAGEESVSLLPGVLLLDTIGELAAVFQKADVVFMGGTLVSRGGHNILEPAYFGKPVIVGPHMENFAEIAATFGSHDALVRIGSAGELPKAVDWLLRDTDDAEEIGARGREIIEASRGVVGKVAGAVVDAMEDAVPAPMAPLPQRVILGPLTWLWAVGHRMNVARGLRIQRRLGTPVISIGGISMGGAGKSPMVAYLAAKLREAGGEPAILTRGYRKKSSKPVVIVPRGASVDIAETGDEAQLYVRQGSAHVGVGGERYDVGRLMEQELAPDVFLLDDGFQHVRLARDEDIVLIDAQNPLGGGLFPLGRRREPLEGLARASIVILTRLASGQQATGLEELVHRYNPAVPVFRSRVVPIAWVNASSGESFPASPEGPNAVPFRSGFAFCGLGSPRSFWRSLRGFEAVGLKILGRETFPDHHAYSAEELGVLMQSARNAGADALLTTEKDVMNFPAGWKTGGALPVYYLKIGIVIEMEQELFRRILAVAGRMHPFGGVREQPGS